MTEQHQPEPLRLADYLAQFLAPDAQRAAVEMLRLYARNQALENLAQPVQLTDEEILSHGGGQDDAVWSFESQIHFARAVIAANRAKAGLA